MISKNRIKKIRSLALKKNRDTEKLFVAEGPKAVTDLASVFPCVYLAALPCWMEKGRPSSLDSFTETDVVNEEELQRISFLQHPQDVLAVFRKPEDNEISDDIVRRNLCIALDDVQNPGNLGTIIRLADWFGITDVFCSLLTADAFGPKTVQATMGALARVHLHYVDLYEFISGMPKDIPVYGTFLNGQNIYKERLDQHGLIVMGNEGNGIQPRIESLVTRRLYIPNYPPDSPTVESLNVAIATAVTCAEFRRQSLL